MFRRIKEMLYRSLESNEISYKKVKDIMRNNANAILLDVRSVQEYNEGHLAGAINIPLYDLEKQIYRIPNKKTTIIIYCASGARSRQAKE